MMASLMKSLLQLALCLRTVSAGAERLLCVSKPISLQLSVSFLAEPASARGTKDDPLLLIRNLGLVT